MLPQPLSLLCATEEMGWLWGEQLQHILKGRPLSVHELYRNDILVIKSNPKLSDFCHLSNYACHGKWPCACLDAPLNHKLYLISAKSIVSPQLRYNFSPQFSQANTFPLNGRGHSVCPIVPWYFQRVQDGWNILKLASQHSEIPPPSVARAILSKKIQLMSTVGGENRKKTHPQKLSQNRPNKKEILVS